MATIKRIFIADIILNLSVASIGHFMAQCKLTDQLLKDRCWEKQNHTRPHGKGRVFNWFLKSVQVLFKIHEYVKMHLNRPHKYNRHGMSVILVGPIDAKLKVHILQLF